MRSYDILAFMIFDILFTRMFLSYKMDRLRGTSSLTFKFLFGTYAFDAVIAGSLQPGQENQTKF